MAKKKFDPTHHNYGLEGERFAFCWLTKLGYIVEAKGDQYGPDLHIHHPERGLTPVEVERRYERSWRSGMFPYDTYNLPERRFQKALSSLLIVLSANMDRALLVYPSSVHRASESGLWVVKDSVHVKGERILDIPVEFCRDVSTNEKGVTIEPQAQASEA